MAMRTFLSAVTLAACGIFSLAASGAEKKDLTVVPEAFKEKVSRPRNWTQRTNPLFSLAAEGVDDIHLAYVGEATPVLVLSNKTSSALSLRGEIKVETFGSESFVLEASGELGAGACRRFELGRSLKKGPWQAVAMLETETARAIAETRFAVVRRREVTPPSPPGVFRAGFNYHMARYPDDVNEKCLKALTQSGAKIVRAGIAASMVGVEAKEGVFDWSRPDRYLGQLDRFGLAKDIMIYGSPQWARDEKHATNGIWCSPMRRGLFRDFCRRIAARYGTRIDWYEIGNEWDLAKPEHLTTDEALEMQREAYEGLKVGCPDVKVIPNGWAVVHSDVIPHRTQRDMHERVMTEGKNLCDAHPVHQHGSYREYRRRLVEFFAWRKARGIDDLPWYSNETALTTAGAGEERAAQCVWQKILFAWMHGSVDYIWYNLRAIGFGPYDGEQGYGVVTADFYPRATFPAFAGLMSCFEGLRPQKVVHEGPNREVYLFAGTRGGKTVQVFVGWDLKAQTNIAVRVRTNAKRAFAVDLFDNRSETCISEGVATLSLGKTPSALMLEEATESTLDETDIRRGEEGEIQDVELGRGEHVFKLQDFDCVFEMYKADPKYFDRVWKGWSDLTAVVKIGRVGDELRVVAYTSDEKHCDGDCLVVIVDGVERRFPCEKSDEKSARYAGRITCPGPEAVVEIRVEDDDGHGKEGWVTTGRFRIKRN